MNMEIIAVDQNMEIETTNYWFEVDGQDYAISDCNGEFTLIHCDGFLVNDCKYHQDLKNILIKEVECYNQQ